MNLYVENIKEQSKTKWKKKSFYVLIKDVDSAIVASR